jgi:hypothetical protein
MGYPGIDIDEHVGEVEGFLFTSENLSSHWKALDEFEGKAYERVMNKVKRKDRTTIDAYIYRLWTGYRRGGQPLGIRTAVASGVIAQSLLPNPTDLTFLECKEKAPPMKKWKFLMTVGLIGGGNLNE